jgi:hypothetical protein
MKTKSQLPATSSCFNRAASRSNRLTRFRTTAPPILRLTEKPKRLWSQVLGKAINTNMG